MDKIDKLIMLWLMIIWILEINNDNKKEKYHDFFIKYLDNNGIYSILRRYACITSYIFLEDYLEKIKIIVEVCELTVEFYSEIRWNNFNKLNEEIIAEIVEQNGE